MEDFNTIAYHALILEEIKRAADERKVHLAQVMMSKFNIGKSAAYKRIQGKYQLSFDEIMQLCILFNLSIDQLMKDKFRPLLFQSDAIIKKPTQFDHYLKNILKHMIQIKAGKNLRVYYMASEMPLFHLIPFMPLFYFKLYMWNKINWRSIDCNLLFDLSDFEQYSELKENAQALASIYYYFNDTEIWNMRMLNTTFDQIKYMLSSHQFARREDVIILIEQLVQLVSHLENIANVGFKTYSKESKSIASQSNIYMNEVSFGQEVILTHSLDGYKVFSTYDHPNFLHSSDTRAGEHIEDWLLNIVKNSTPISRDNSKERQFIFRNLQKHVEYSAKEVRGLLDYLY